MTPESRAYNADDTLLDYSGMDGVARDNSNPLTDLLADLMHYCDHHGSSFDEALESARIHFEAEKG